VSHRRRPQPQHRPSSPTSLPPPQAATPPAGLPDVDALLDALANGDLDLHLDALAEARSRRLKLLQTAREAILMATLRQGDRVLINHSARPQYLHGEPATVIGWAGDKVVVRLDQPIGKFVNGEVRCPPAVLDPLRPRPVRE
jgi:hypothetical protein